LAALVFPAVAAIAETPETFCIARGAWTCNAPGAIEDVERLAKQESSSGADRFSDEFDKLANRAGCGVPLPDSHRITVMHADDKFVFFCERDRWRDIHTPQQDRTGFVCSWTLISDIRDSFGHQVSSDQLVRASAKTTMRDVADSALCTQR